MQFNEEEKTFNVINRNLSYLNYGSNYKTPTKRQENTNNTPFQVEDFDQPRRSSIKKIDLDNQSKKFKKRQSNVTELFDQHNQIGNFLESELMTQIKTSKEENIILLKDKEQLLKANGINQEILSEKSREIDILNEKLKLMKDVVKKTESEIRELRKNSNQISDYGNSEILTNLKEEIYCLKNLNNEINTENDILKLHIEEKEKLITYLNNSIENLNLQISNNSKKYSQEINELLNKINIFEKDKITLELKIKEISEEKNLKNNNNIAKGSKFLNISDNNSKDLEISEKKKIKLNLINENKYLLKKLEDLKNEYEIKIEFMNNELKTNDLKIQEFSEKNKKLEIENINLNEKFSKIEKNYFSNLTEANDFKLSNNDNFNLASEKIREIKNIKNDLESKLILFSSEIYSLKNNNETLNQIVDRQKKMEIALKNELLIKEQEMTKRTEFINNLQNEITSRNEENINLKKENFTIKSRLDFLENEITSKYEYELNSKNHEIYILNEKNLNFMKNIENLNEKLINKENIINLKKNAYFVIMEIVNLKKSEVECLVAMEYMNSNDLKENINLIRKNENDLITK